MATPQPLHNFSCLTLDCFGTLIDWEGGIYAALSPLMRQLPRSHPLFDNRLEILREFVRHEGQVQAAQPTELYSTVLSAAYGNFAAELGVKASAADKTTFGTSVGDWPAFPDTLEALRRLKSHFKLVILSNVDRESFGRTLCGPLAGIDFDAVYTAQEIGSYKPDLRNFQYLIKHCQEDLGVSQDQIIHTAQSLFHDIVPATEVGLASAWIERGEDMESVMGGNLRDFGAKAKFSWRFQNMAAMADASDTA